MSSEKHKFKTRMGYHYTPGKKGKIQNTNNSKCVKNRDSHSLLGGMQNGTATLDDSLAAS